MFASCCLCELVGKLRLEPGLMPGLENNAVDIVFKNRRYNTLREHVTLGSIGIVDGSAVTFVIREATPSEKAEMEQISDEEEDMSEPEDFEPEAHLEYEGTELEANLFFVTVDPERGSAHTYDYHSENERRYNGPWI